MKEYGKNELFETVRQAPTELSQQQVMEIITVLPTLPPPGSSWFNINLNSIIMTTTVVAIISTAVIWFTNPITPSELPGQEPENLSTIQQSVEEKEDTIQVDPQPLTTKAAVPITPEEAVPVSAPEPESADVPDRQVNTSTEVQKADKFNDSLAAIAKVDIQNVPEPLETSASPEKAPDNLVITPGAVAEEPSPEAKTNTNNSPDKLLNDIQLRKLKRNLMKKLAQDKIIKNRREYMTILEYTTSGVMVNFKPLTAQQNAYYKGFLDRYGIKPGPDKRIVVESKFIMVGNFTDNGFLGSALGKSMNITFDGSKVRFHGLLDQEKITTDPIASGSKRKNNRSDNNMMFSTEGKVQDSEGNLLSAQRLTASGPGEGGIFEEDTHVIDNAVTMTNTDTDTNPVELSSLNINKLKKDLYRYLVKDDQVKSNKADVNMTLGTGPFSVNANNAFSASMQERYTQLFRTYGIALRPKLKILMSTDFIFVGEFGEDNFNGSVQGVLVKEKIEGSIFEEELGQYTLFGKSNEPEDVATEQRSVKSFDRVRVSGLAVVYYSQGPEKDLRLEVSGMPLEDVITEVKNGELHVYTSMDKTFIGESIKVFVSSPAIKSIFVDDAAEFKGQTQITEETLKVSSFGAGAVELGVDVGRLHLVMDGGDIDIEGKATMERTDFLNDANDGQLDQSGLRVMKNWEPEEKISDSGKDLTELKDELTEKLIGDGFIESSREKVTISFSRTSLEIGGDEVSDNQLIGYLQLFKTYGMSLRNERKLFLGREFIVIADRNNGKFEFEMRGTNLSFNTRDSWEELEDDIFNRRD